MEETPVLHEAGTSQLESLAVLAPSHAAPASTSLATIAQSAQPVVTIVPHDCACGGNNGAAAEAAPAAPGFIYAIGSLRTVEPTPGLSKEFGFAVSSLRNWLPNGELPYEVLSQGQYLYIAREVCWVLQIDGSNSGASVDAYIVKPRSYVELYDMVSGLEPISTSDRRFDVIIGPRGPIAPVDYCAGLQLPLVVANHIYSFTETAFVAAIAERTGTDTTTAKYIFEQFLDLGDNAGETDEHRALNYIILRYPDLYQMAVNMLRGVVSVQSSAADGAIPIDPYRSCSLVEVSVHGANVQGVRRIVDVIFHYEYRETGEPVYWFCKVDVTGQFPFLVRPLARYYPHP
ncbi:MAG TPA: hypothetical protein VHI13_08535 [Candidatus Kapabacteria bacterium]|nr:hypothetical protein [Candidatus Kapabacteria bacterium]